MQYLNSYKGKVSMSFALPAPYLWLKKSCHTGVTQILGKGSNPIKNYLS